MASMQKFIAIGNLGSDPETRFTPDGSPVVNISIATTDRWKDKNTQQPRERTEWHRLVFFRRRAEIVQQFLTKGSSIYIEGEQRTREWMHKDGSKRYTTETIVTVLKMLGGKKETDIPAVPSEIEDHELQNSSTVPADYLADVPDDLPDSDIPQS